jgi:hypothetical protein
MLSRQGSRWFFYHHETTGALSFATFCALRYAARRPAATLSKTKRIAASTIRDGCFSSKLATLYHVEFLEILMLF